MTFFWLILCIWLIVGTFFWYFDFFRDRLKICRGIRGGRRPTTTPANFQSIAKQNQNTQKKVPTTQPNAQYWAKNNVSIHVIETFMPILEFDFHFAFSVSYFICKYYTVLILFYQMDVTITWQFPFVQQESYIELQSVSVF